MKLLVTGASSFVGAHFCRAAARQHTIHALYYSTPIALNGVSPHRIDLRTKRDVQKTAALDFDAVVHIACRIRGRPKEGETTGQAAWRENRAMMDAVLSFGKPVVYASSTVVHWEQETPYAQSRREDEQRLRDSGLPWAILRPSAPYARALAHHRPGHRESFHTLISLVRSAPIVPVIGNGKYRRQPIHIDDFSAAILALLENGLPDQAFDAGGAEALTFNEIIDTIARQANRKVRKLHLPKALYVQIARLSPDFDPDLISAIDEDELADPSDLIAATGVHPRSFAEGVATLL
ncbi:MAG: nucleoside-diphosphate-sugar epimerase [Myxococcota bacterium]|jgi:nucleoside-diphosphate-sugar epimerase